MAGIVISYFIAIGISLAIGDGNYYPCIPSLLKSYDNEVTALIIQTLLSGVLGAGFGGCSLIWEKDDWSLLKQTSIYFLIIAVLMMSVAYICEWMEHSIAGILGYFAIFLAIFIVIWVIQYMIWKVRISKIKEGIQKNN